MKRIGRTVAVAVTLGIGLGIVGTRYMDAQPPAVKRTELLRTAMVEMDGKEAHIWIADIAPGTATGSHRHPTTRFVYVVEGSVTAARRPAQLQERERDGICESVPLAVIGEKTVPGGSPTPRSAESGPAPG